MREAAVCRPVGAMQKSECSQTLWTFNCVRHAFHIHLMEIDEEDCDRHTNPVEPSVKSAEQANNRSVSEWLERSGSVGPSGNGGVEDELGNLDTGVSRAAIAEQDGIQRLTTAITGALDTVREGASTGVTTRHLVSRLSSGKDRPTFSGDVLEWPAFKRAFNLTTERGGYTEEENMARLYGCLRGTAREAVASLMITTSTTKEIMDILQLRFGNPDLVAQKILRDIKRLPKIDINLGNLVIFATKVRNYVAAMESVNHVGYLHSSELGAQILDKMPPTLIHQYTRYVDQNRDSQEPRLVSLSRFLFNEAELVCRAGVRRVHESRPRLENGRREDSWGSRRAAIRGRQSAAFTTISRDKAEGSQQLRNEKTKEQTGKCSFCDNPRHQEGIDAKNVSPRSVSTRDAMHTLLHRAGRPNKRTDTARQEADTESAEPEVTANTWPKGEKKILLKILPFQLCGPRGDVTTYALVDEGSTVTLVDADLAEKIEADGPLAALSLQGIKNMETTDRESKKVNFAIAGMPDGPARKISGARTVRQLSLPCQSISEKVLRKFAHLTELVGECCSDVDPKVLLGQDNWDLIVSREIRESGRNAPVASRTELGWVVHGYAPTRSERRNDHRTLALEDPEINGTNDIDTDRTKKDMDLYALIKAHFGFEGMGITIHSRKHVAIQRAESLLAATTRQIEGRWETGLLWKDDAVQLPNNHHTALNRLKVLEHRMDRDPKFGKAYAREIKNLNDNDYATKVIDAKDAGPRTWYLPHFGVTNPNKPGKLGLVFDAAARTQGVSLNDKLLSGPDLLNSLLGVLMRFRQRRVAFTGDIKEMFLQIKIRREDRNAQRFLWRDMRGQQPTTYQMTSMIFGATSSPCSAQYVKNRNAQAFEAIFPSSCSAIVHKHYMDDYLDSVDTDEEAIRLIREVTEVHKHGGFEIRGWSCNSKRVLESLTVDKATTGTVSLTLDEHSVDRTLGVI
ncbi:uncharacterized protein LOC105698948 [Orussus abietinus]|uniref:uncharacterized protein LOC105698948 n=1 Tax=Orussus abietinus TaxID=222816 RepID=UPI000626C76F|nr:uncharacterized protein LOC105698948 [Orussus abietinus]